ASFKPFTPSVRSFWTQVLTVELSISYSFATALMDFLFSSTDKTTSILSFSVCLLILLDIINAPHIVVEIFYYFSVHYIGSISLALGWLFFSDRIDMINAPKVSIIIIDSKTVILTSGKLPIKKLLQFTRA